MWFFWMAQTIMKVGNGFKEMKDSIWKDRRLSIRMFADMVIITKRRVYVYQLN